MTVGILLGVVMSSADLKADIAIADLIRDLAYAQEARKKQFAAIVRFVQDREAKGPAKDMMEQIRRDLQLCKLLVDIEDRSEIIGMMEFVPDFKMKPPPRRHSPKTAGSKR
jgi:hypothetical protein